MTALAVACAFCLCWLTLAALLRRERLLPMDHPNERSLHVAPKPRIGGVGIMAGVAVATAILADAALAPVMLAALALAALSLLDDVRGLPVGLRMVAHVAVATACLLFLGLDGWPLLGAVLAVVWMTNLYNFMDGADGLAGGMAVIGFGTLALLAWMAEAVLLGAHCAAVALAALAFLRFNFPPARLFMGDSGSIPLGFLAATLAIVGVLQQVWHWSVPLLAFSPFIVDASVTLLARLRRGERIWRAHRTHYYQRLVRGGWSHRRLAYAAYALMTCAGAAAFAVTLWPDWRWGVLAAVAVGYLALTVAIDSRVKESDLAD